MQGLVHPERYLSFETEVSYHSSENKLNIVLRQSDAEVHWLE